MDTLINFRRPGLDLELLKARCFYSRLKGSRRMPTETVEALISEALREELAEIQDKLAHTKLAVHVRDKTEKELRTKLVLAKLDAEIFEVLYDKVCAERNAYIRKSKAQIANIREAIDWLWGFYDGNTLVARPGYEDEIQLAWVKLLMSAD